MRKFILTLSLFGVLVICAAEIFLRMSGLASVVMDRQLSDHQMYIFKPGESGHRTRGMRAEVNAYYHINAQGWNSELDYDHVSDSTVAVVGDSYIVGFFNDVDQTVAALLQQLIGEVEPGTEVHSYGHPGANFRDYENLTTYLKKLGYQKIYVYIAANDFQAKKAAYTKKTKYDGHSGFRYWHLQSATARYLIANLGISKMLASKMSKKNNKPADTAIHKKEALCRLEAFPEKDVVFFYQDDFFDDLETHRQLLKISHTLQPIDHGFDRHWNVNGNKNAAQTIFQHWKTKRNHNEPIGI